MEQEDFDTVTLSTPTHLPAIEALPAQVWEPASPRVGKPWSLGNPRSAWCPVCLVRAGHQWVH